ncbi:hypothetical protein HMPREF1486_00713 [Streptomyces sp. HPH0547]|nr:hypothetical protein HMPREF1486_00713 [Streptomyces sp. HPH0547]
MSASVSAYEPLRPLSAMPTPPSRELTGSSHGSGHRSVSAPNSGCATEDSSEAARTRPEAAA